MDRISNTALLVYAAAGIGMSVYIAAVIAAGIIGR